MTHIHTRKHDTQETTDGGDRIFTKVVKAGRRTYFFDVRATRGNDHYLTVTESKKSTAEDGCVTFDRHKIFLYKEDFGKFIQGFSDALTFINNCKSDNSAPIGGGDFVVL